VLRVIMGDDVVYSDDNETVITEKDISVTQKIE